MHRERMGPSKELRVFLYTARKRPEGDFSETSFPGGLMHPNTRMSHDARVGNTVDMVPVLFLITL